MKSLGRLAAFGAVLGLMFACFALFAPTSSANVDDPAVIKSLAVQALSLTSPDGKVLFTLTAKNAQTMAITSADGERTALIDVQNQGIALRSPNGKRTITLTTQDDYAGIYMHYKETGSTAHLWDAKGTGPAIGFFKDARAGKPCDAALSLTGSVGYLQLARDGDVTVLDAADLIKRRQVIQGKPAP